MAELDATPPPNNDVDDAAPVDVELTEPDPLAGVDHDDPPPIEDDTSTQDLAPAAVIHYDDSAQADNVSNTGASSQTGASGDSNPPRDVYASVYEWWQQWMAPRYCRSLYSHARSWCPEPWRHPEAVSRLHWLWRSWEQLHRDPGGLISWWTHYADHNMTVLLSADGPFMDCNDGHRDPEQGSAGTRPLPTFDHHPPTPEVP